MNTVRFLCCYFRPSSSKQHVPISDAGFTVQPLDNSRESAAGTLSGCWLGVLFSNAVPQFRTHATSISPVFFTLWAFHSSLEPLRLQLYSQLGSSKTFSSYHNNTTGADYCNAVISWLRAFLAGKNGSKGVIKIFLDERKRRSGEETREAITRLKHSVWSASNHLDDYSQRKWL